MTATRKRDYRGRYERAERKRIIHVVRTRPKFRDFVCGAIAHGDLKAADIKQRVYDRIMNGAEPWLDDGVDGFQLTCLALQLKCLFSPLELIATVEIANESAWVGLRARFR